MSCLNKADLILSSELKEYNKIKYFYSMENVVK